MKKQLNCLLTAIGISITFYTASAQSDSLLDLGRIKLRKDFTQNITIKGSDMERMPFNNLADALLPWLQGAFTSQTTLVYVIDGVIMNDVNAYSIHDIEEVTLVQNALTRVNGALNLQQLVLVKTKRNSANGLSINGGSFLTTRDVRPQKSENNFYHQYHISAWKNAKNTGYGLSANFLRDVSPYYKDFYYSVKKPNHMDRYRFNGWFNAALGEGHSIEARINFVPQSTGVEIMGINNVRTEFLAKTKQTLFNPSLKLTNRIARGLTNEIHVSYITARVRNENSTMIVNQPGFDGFFNRFLTETDNLMVREHLGYHKEFGNWQIDPALNFTYRNIKLVEEFNGAAYDDGQVTNATFSRFTNQGKFYVLTPSFSISHGNSFNFTGGISADLSENNRSNDIYPFASVTLDILRLGNPGSQSGLKIFGSYSSAANFADLEHEQIGINFEDRFPGKSDYGGFSVTESYFGPYPQNRKLSGVQAGALFSLRGEKLQLSYNYDNREYIDLVARLVPSGPNNVIIVTTWVEHAFNGHRLGLSSAIANKPGFQWKMGLNTSTFTVKPKEPVPPNPEYATTNNDGTTLWTGGFTNRVQVKNFSFGVDMIYFLNEVRQVSENRREKFDNWRVNNVHAGYKLKVQERPLEVYISSNNPVQSKNSFFINDRRYYGAGFKLEL